MISVIPPGDTEQIAIIGKTQGYLGLAVLFGLANDPVTKSQTPSLTTAWQPTPAELEALNAGASVLVNIINVQRHPPIAVYVGEPPSPD